MLTPSPEVLFKDDCPCFIYGRNVMRDGVYRSFVVPPQTPTPWTKPTRTPKTDRSSSRSESQAGGPAGGRSRSRRPPPVRVGGQGEDRAGGRPPNHRPRRCWRPCRG